MLRYSLALIVVLGAATAPGGAPAATNDSGVFDVYLGGIRAGILAYAGIEEAGRYTASGSMRSSGLMALIQDVGFDAKSSGRITSSGFVPERYEERANTGDRVSEAVMEYRSGVPQLKTYSPPQKPRPRDVDPATQGGTLDPMTTIYSLLRDVSDDDICQMDMFMFDGKRRSHVTATGAEPEDDGVICSGEYVRVEGFSKREMDKKVRFPFRLTYSPLGEGRYRVTRVVFETLYGKAVFNRR